MVVNYNILITGSNGQLGKALEKLNSYYINYNLYFRDKDQLNISEFNDVEEFVVKFKINVIINCAAFTNVELAEKNKNLANLVNNISVENIARLCSIKNIQLIHISTDYVFDGLKKQPYKESDRVNPINFYGLSKLNAERNIMKFDLKKSVIIRTSWLYSGDKNNFVGKIIEMINNHKNIEVVSDEIGSPTNVNDLANFILFIIPKLKNSKTEILNFSNSGYCSRYELAVEINRILKGTYFIKPIQKYKSSVKRPKYTVLDCKKIKELYNFRVNDWKTSLKNHIYSLKNNPISHEF